MNRKNSIAALFPGAIEDAAILSIKVLPVTSSFLQCCLSYCIKQVCSACLARCVSAILPSLTGDGITAVLRGIMEISSGSSAIAHTVNTPAVVQLSLVSFICGFAGFSVHTQVMGIMKGTGARYGVFFLGKILHGGVACILTIAALSLLPVSLATSNLKPMVSGIPSSFRIITIMILIVALVINPYENGGSIRHSNKTVKK